MLVTKDDWSIASSAIKSPAIVTKLLHEILCVLLILLHKVLYVEPVVQLLI